MKIDIIAIGRLNKGSLFDTFQSYSKRMRWAVNLVEHDSKQKSPKAAQKDEQDKILSSLDNRAYVIALDERGRSVGSQAFAKKIGNIQLSGQSHIQFVLGGADGLTDAVRKRADFLLSFGEQTWPHMLARVMLLEQVYRAQQILSGHPYHRE